VNRTVDGGAHSWSAAAAFPAKCAARKTASMIVWATSRETTRTGRQIACGNTWRTLSEIEKLKAALGEAHVELRVWKRLGGGSSGPLKDVEVIRTEAGMPTARFTRLVGIPERTYRRSTKLVDVVGLYLDP
jgi:hypothetical protein